MAAKLREDLSKQQQEQEELLKEKQQLLTEEVDQFTNEKENLEHQLTKMKQAKNEKDLELLQLRVDKEKRIQDLIGEHEQKEARQQQESL